MTETEAFMNDLAAIAARNDTEAAKIQAIRDTLDRYVARATEFYSGEQEPRERVRSWVSNLADVIGAELNKRPVGPLGFVLDQAHEITTDWVHRH